MQTTAYQPDAPRPPDSGEDVARGSSPTLTQPPGQPDDDLLMPAGGSEPSRSADADDGIKARLLRLCRSAKSSAETYTTFTRKNWQRAHRSFNNRHFVDSKYNSKDYAARSKLFRPKTRAAVRKAMASHAASLFSTRDAMTIDPGNEADPTSRAAAALLQEVINYRTSRTSGRNAIPWFLTCMGAVQNGTLTGIIVSKQSWKLTTKEVGETPVFVTDENGEPILDEAGQPIPLTEPDPQTGVETAITKPVLKTVIDRPDCVLVAPENVIIDSGADWTNPGQDAAFLCIEWPMKIDQIREKEKDPRDPWFSLTDSQLRSGQTDSNTGNSRAIRTSREGGTDRYDQTNSANEFTTIWVQEWYIRAGGEDYTFYAINGQHYLTDPKSVEEVYPWNGGERPLAFGYASLEAHKIFPMSPAESWQPLQSEINDLGNLTLDTVKMNIAPIAKVARGRQVDLEKLRRRGPGTNLLLSNMQDVEFEKAPSVDAGAWQQVERLNNDFDSLAGQFDQASVMSSRQLNETVGGMRLLAGSSNAIAEYDQRVVIETWVEPALGQIVKLCQYYEHDETILALCGDRAKLWQKFGVSQITDELLDAQITTSIDLGIGAADPQQRLGKFTMAVGALTPIVKTSKKFATGEYEFDIEEAFEACFGAVGFRDGGKRFLIKNPPPQGGPSPAEQLELADKQATIEQKRATANLNLAKAGAVPDEARIRVAELIADIIGSHADRHERNVDRLEGVRRDLANRADTRASREAATAATAEPQLVAPTAPQGGPGPTADPMIGSGNDGQAPPQPQQPGGAADIAGLLSGQRHQNVHLIRGPHGDIAGAMIEDANGNKRLVHFQRDAQGRIANFSVIDGAARHAGPQIELPPPNLHQMRPPQPGGRPLLPPRR